MPFMISDQRTVSKSSACLFSILIPTWNNLPYLQLCIESIRQHSTFPHQIIVHINEGTDGTLEWVKQQTDIDYTYSSSNIGVCYALNAARPLVQTDFIVYLNDDMYVCPDWDRVLWEEIQQLPDCFFFLSCTALEPVASSNCAIQANFGSDPAHFRKQELLAQYATFQKPDWLGATWPPNVIHRNVWDLVGGYSIEFSPGMYSDPDFSMKLWQAGVRYFKGLSASRVYHFGSKSTKRIRKNKGYYTFIRKWGMTSSTFTRYYLHRGEPFTGPLDAPRLPSRVKWKNKGKKILASFYPA
ncbi:glycosyltransferase family 2 protein [Thermoflavifilum thermophilum]|uniref:Glycosyltransferase, GT2 family n=1 Tax=Thermoflavifilum thermophilum TaxID=1393122 RepID=A0A1I7NDG7_9BACT|nr:glycosyltransferase family 2 protein [Thermoflavifilum thermophilum]SFV32596.1 Glycosyltransferase, GT2 family [Thermoflavifilum thermophilum]